MVSWLRRLFARRSDLSRKDRAVLVLLTHGNQDGRDMAKVCGMWFGATNYARLYRLELRGWIDSVRHEDGSGARRYSITDLGRKILDESPPDPPPSARAVRR